MPPNLDDITPYLDDDDEGALWLDLNNLENASELLPQLNLLSKEKISGLDISGCQGITRADIASLAQYSCLSELQDLDLGWTNFGDAWVPALAGLASIKTINADGCKLLTNSGALVLLDVLPNLEMIDVGDSGVDREGVASLKNKRPGKLVVITTLKEKESDSCNL